MSGRSPLKLSEDGQGRPTLDDVSGYSVQHLQAAVFDRLSEFTGSHIRQKIESFALDLASAERRGAPVFVSVGENCGPALRLQEVSAPSVGGGYFDFLVLKPGSFEHLLRNDFSNMLMLKNLEVGRWEGNDSIYDAHYGIWYHHLFHLPDEKRWPHSRRIDETDIPLLLSVARAQFEYLHEKFRMLLRSPLPKSLVYRGVDGKALSERRIDVVLRALQEYGARNWTLSVVYSTGQPEPAVAHLHRRIEETEGWRWGDPRDWRQFVDETLSLSNA